MRILCLGLIATLMVVGSAMAQPGGGGGRGGGGRGGFDPATIIDRMFEQDANEDGKLTAEELGDRGARALERLDTDKDGSITKDEALKAMEARGGGGPGGERGGRGGRGGRSGRGGGMERILTILPLFKVLDKDENGELSSEEIENAVAALKTLDKNDDGKLVAEEMLPDPTEFGGGPGGEGGRGGFGGGRGGRGGGGGRGGERPERPEFD